MIAPKGKTHEVVLGILLAILFGLSSFTLFWTFNANADLKVLQAEVDGLEQRLEKFIERRSKRKN